MFKLPIILFALTLISWVSFGQTTKKTWQLQVAGNCEHCKERIESALDQPGVKKAVWSEKTGMATILADTTKTDLMTLSAVVAKAGHDTKDFKATDGTYNDLPKCCRYPRETQQTAPKK